MKVSKVVRFLHIVAGLISRVPISPRTRRYSVHVTPHFLPAGQIQNIYKRQETPPWCLLYDGAVRKWLLLVCCDTPFIFFNTNRLGKTPSLLIIESTLRSNVTNQNSDSLSVITVQEMKHHICSAGLVTCWCVRSMKLKRLFPEQIQPVGARVTPKEEKSAAYREFSWCNREWRHAGRCVVHPVHAVRSRNTWRLWHGDDGTETPQNSLLLRDFSGCLKEYAGMCKRTEAGHQRFCPDNDPFRLQPHRLKWNCLTKSVDYQRHAALL